MATFMQWALGLLVGFVVLQLGDAIMGMMNLGTAMEAVLVLITLVIAVRLGMAAMNRSA